MRHGQSVWNIDNKFTGWVDVPLTQKGEDEARKAAQYLKEANLEFDIAYTSVLKRAIKTLWLVQENTDQEWIPVVRDWRLNERYYGALTGLNKSETAEKMGEDKVLLWRRSYDIPPPDIDRDSEYFPGHDRRYKDLRPEQLPTTESLKTTKDRVLPYWNETILPDVLSGKRVLIVAHGNSLRALIKELDNVSDEDIVGINIPTGLSGAYLGDREAIEAEIKKVASQAAKKKE
ncbi:gpmA [Symbiodinium sp. KB8]|nr:gpmA [Symbiodinium sp. KB8]